MARGNIFCKRIYEEPAESDGYRVLVDRLWPRGIRKADAGIADWVKDIAPTSALRQKFGHVPDRYEEFREQYRQELENSDKAAEFFKTCSDQLKSRNVTLLYAAKDPERNNAAVLKDWLSEKLGSQR